MNKQSLISHKLENKNNSKHLILEIENFSQVFQKEAFKEFIHLPSRKIPKSFLVEDQNSLCFGYYLIFDRPMDENKITALCREGKWSSLANHIGDFLVVFVDFNLKTLYVLSDMFGTFPCYFSFQDNKLVLSTDFGVITKSLPNKELNLDRVLDFVFMEDLLTPTNTTIIKQIQSLPPGTLLKIDRNGQMEWHNLQDKEAFINHESVPYNDANEFLNDFLKLLTEITGQRIKALGVNKVEVDLSSGFDCTLVAYILSRFKDLDLHCYSKISQLAPGDTDPRVMGEFAKRHNLKVKMMKTECYYPYATQEGLDWTTNHFFPPSHGLEEHLAFVDYIIKDGLNINFTGNGGDEIYMSPSIGKIDKYPLQDDYFWFVDFLRSDVRNVFSENGIDQVFDKRRFFKKEIFPAYISNSAICLFSHYFPVYWEKDLWWIHPLVDPRLIQLARRIPRKENGEPMNKYELWAHRPDIFLPEQAKIRGHYGAHVGQFVTKQSQFMIKVLRNSILGELGIIKRDEIVSNLEKGNFAPYLGTALLFLQQLVRLEYFLQQNILI